MRYVVRPKGTLTTPRILKNLAEADRTWVFPNKSNKVFDYQKDFLFCVVPPENLINEPEGYTRLRSFYKKNKEDQRYWLDREGFPTPNCYAPYRNLFVERPLRHKRGNDFKITNSALAPEGYYSSPLFYRTHEYRIIVVKGKPIITILKNNKINMTQEECWNVNEQVEWITVRDWGNNRLRYTDVYDKIKNNKTLSIAHILGIDILLNFENKTYAICEINFVPALEIRRNTFDIINEWKRG